MSAGTRSVVVTAVTQMQQLYPHPDDPGRCRSVPVRARWLWDAIDPWAIGLGLFTGDRWVCWRLAIELVTAGLAGPAGIGDVGFLPDPASPTGVLLHLSSPDGQAWLRQDRTWLAEFLARLPDPHPLADVLVAALDPDDFVPGGRFGPDPVGGVR